VEDLANRYGMGDRSIVMRMTGCANGCARPYVAEIGFVGKGPGRYNLLLGGDGTGRRLARLYRKNLNEEGLLETLDHLFGHFAANSRKNEGFGDFTIRSGLVKPVLNPAEDFHESA